MAPPISSVDMFVLKKNIFADSQWSNSNLYNTSIIKNQGACALSARHVHAVVAATMLDHISIISAEFSERNRQ